MRLSESEVRQRLADLPSWTLAGDRLAREYVFPSFPDAIAFVTRLAFEAESADHHPDLRVRYKKVEVTWRTHSADGITAKDFDGARTADTVAARFDRR
jgi:4a-hydroxytetrahydrobiopterin dehydratase